MYFTWYMYVSFLLYYTVWCMVSHAELKVSLDLVGASASSSSMLPSSLPLEKKSVVGHVSGEGLAPIVSTYSRLMLVDGTVL